MSFEVVNTVIIVVSLTDVLHLCFFFAIFLSGITICSDYRCFEEN